MLVRHVLHLADQAVQRIDAGIQVVLDGVEVALISVRNLRRDVAGGDAADIVRGDLQRTDDGVERPIDSVDDLPEIARVFCCIDSGREPPFQGGGGQDAGVASERTDRGFQLCETAVDLLELLANFNAVLICRTRREIDVQVSLSELHQVRGQPFYFSGRVALRGESCGQILNHLDITNMLPLNVDEIGGVLLAAHAAPVEETLS
jgi:hypothetical protein